MTIREGLDEKVEKLAEAAYDRLLDLELDLDMNVVRPFVYTQRFTSVRALDLFRVVSVAGKEQLKVAVADMARQTVLYQMVYMRNEGYYPEKLLDELLDVNAEELGARVRELVDALALEREMGWLEVLMDDDQILLMQAMQPDKLKDLLDDFYEFAEDRVQQYLESNAVGKAVDMFWEEAQRRS